MRITRVAVVSLLLLSAPSISSAQAPPADPEQPEVGEIAKSPKKKKGAAKDPDKVSSDKYSVVSEQKLLLTGEISNTLPKHIFKRLYGLMGLERFNMTLPVKDPNDPAVEAWCEAAIRDTQVRKDNVDGETGDAHVTLKAKLERCSEVFKHDMHVDHNCVRKVPKKGKPYMECEIKASVTITKYKADQATGKLHYSIDRKFGAHGKIVKQDKSTGSGSLSGDTTVEQANESALKSAALVCGLFLKRKLRDIKEFQLHTPVVAAKDGWALGCIGKDTTELDTPFYIKINTDKGEVHKGFVKARKIYDGCTMTPSMKKAAKKGNRFKLKPMEAEIILGGDDIKAGHTFWEMPSIGLNVGPFVGINGSVGFFSEGNVGPGGGLLLEFNLAPYLGISELHVFESTTIMGVIDSSPIVDAFEAVLPGVVTGATLAIHADLGVVKRWYLGGPFFAEVGGALSISAYILETIDLGDDDSLGLMGVGVTALGGAGFQLTPRILLKLNLGYFVAGTIVSADYKGVDYSDQISVGAEHGPVIRLIGLYNI